MLNFGNSRNLSMNLILYITFSSWVPQHYFRHKMPKMIHYFPYKLVSPPSHPPLEVMPPFSLLCSLEALESFTCVCSPVVSFSSLASGLASPSSSLHCHHSTLRLILMLTSYRNFHFLSWICLIHNSSYLNYCGSVTSALVVPFYPNEPFSVHCLLLLPASFFFFLMVVFLE